MTKKILYIEDNAAHQFTMELLLSDTYQVITTLDGESGLEQARKLKPDIIIVDIQLHNSSIDGYEVINIIKSSPELKHIPIIAITAHTGQSEKEKCFRLGFDGFFTKPLNVETFENDISHYL